MSNLTCMICGYTHPTMISPSHIKTHGISTKEYKEKFPNARMRIQSEESKAKASKTRKGKPSWNKGLKTGPNEALSLAKKGKPNVKLQGQKRSKEQKIKISEGTKFAMRNGLSDQTKLKISESHKRKVLDGTFIPSMLGKKLSDETKLKISEASKKSLMKKRLNWVEDLKEKLKNDNLIVENLSAANNVNLKCQKCKTSFTFSRQYFSDSSEKYHNSRREKICPCCYPRDTTKSKKELELLEFIRSITDLEVLSGNRTVIFPREIDIYIPILKLGFEFCGIYWHSEQIALTSGGRAKYHIFEKHKECEDKGIRIITIFEDEWDNKNEIVKSRIKHLLNKTSNKTFARKVKIRSIDYKQSSTFLINNHIQGTDKPEIALGAFYNNELVSVMTFKKTNFVKGGTGNEWELNRFASKTNFTVVGMAAKFLKYFNTNFNIDNKPIISYSDNRWSVGNVYETLGFAKVQTSKPGYWYVPLKMNKSERIHRSNFMRHRLHNIFKNSDYKNKILSEYEIMQQEGYDRIWDCGTTKWQLVATGAEI